MPSGSSSARALRATTLFQVSPDGPCFCCLISSVLPPSRCYLRSIFLLRQYVGTLIDAKVFWFLLFPSCSFASGFFKERITLTGYQSSSSTTRVSSSMRQFLTERDGARCQGYVVRHCARRLYRAEVHSGAFR